MALDTMLDRLSEDHATAKQLAAGLATIPGFECSPDATPTNILMFRLPADVPAVPYVDRLEERGVRLNYPDGPRVRAVTNRMVDAGDIDRAVEMMRDVARELRAGRKG